MKVFAASNEKPQEIPKAQDPTVVSCFMVLCVVILHSCF